MVRRAQAELRLALVSKPVTGSDSPSRQAMLDEVIRRTRAAIEADEPSCP